MAVGVTVDTNKVDELRETFDRAVGEYQAKNNGEFSEIAIEIAAWLETADLTPELFDQIASLSPFGEGNPEPIFGLKDIEMPAGAMIFGEKNFRFQIALPSFARLGVVAWHKAHRVPEAGTRIDLALKLSWNNYNGRKYQQAELIDWKPVAED